MGMGTLRVAKRPAFAHPPQRILFLLFGAIGDVTRALPLLTRVRRGYPRAHIAWAVEPAAAPLLEEHPALDEVILYDRTKGPRQFWPFLQTIRRKKFDLVLDLQRHAKSGLTSLWSGARVRIGFHRRNSKEANYLCNTHTIAPVPNFSLKLRQYLSFAGALGLADDGVHFDLRLRDVEQQRVDRLLADTPRPFVAFFVGSRWSSRFWFPTATAEVARTLWREYAAGTVLLGGRSEAAFASRVSAALGNVQATDLSGRTSVRDLIGIFSRARLGIGPDSGPMHIAAAVGTPVISLWGATSPIRSAPWGSKDFVLGGRAACSPCYTRNCKIGRACMRRISPERVLDMTRHILDHAPRQGTVGV